MFSVKESFEDITINGKKFIIHVVKNKYKSILVISNIPERQLDSCYCSINADGSIEYGGNEEWQCSGLIKNPKFPQELPGGIALDEKDYNEAMELLIKDLLRNRLS